MGAGTRHLKCTAARVAMGQLWPPLALALGCLVLSTTGLMDTVDRDSCHGKYHYIYDKSALMHSLKIPISIREMGKSLESNSYQFGDMYATENVLIDEFENSPCATEEIRNATYYIVPISFTRIAQGWDKNGVVYIDFFGIKLLFTKIATILRTEHTEEWATGNNVFIVSHDFGSCLAPDEIARDQIIISPNGDTLHHPGTTRLTKENNQYCMMKHNFILDAHNKLAASNYTILIGQVKHASEVDDFMETYTCRSCYLEGNRKMIVTPPFVGSHMELSMAREFFSINDISSKEMQLSTAVNHSRHIFISFRGTVLDSNTRYSHCGVRQALKRLFLSAGERSAHKQKKVVFSESLLKKELYLEELAKSTFCLCPPGWAGWSPRWIESIAMGCIPIFFTCPRDQFDTVRRVYYPFENYIDYDRFSITVNLEDIEGMEEMLEKIHTGDIIRMQRAMKKTYKKFIIGLSKEAGATSYQNSDAFRLILQSLREI